MKDSPNSPAGFPSNYLQPSPVRGQLEPWNERSAKGWRYIQCTDTPNEFKVLLPPRTAALYDQLLQAEVRELSQPPPHPWERILEIRRLKERMLRKCQRLSKIIGPARGGRHRRGEAYTFQTALAPADFRLKEMEKWLRTGGLIQKASSSQVSAAGNPARNSYCCSRCASGRPHRPTETTTPTTSSKSKQQQQYAAELPLDRPLPSPSSTHSTPRAATPRLSRPSSTRDLSAANDGRRHSTSSTITRRSSSGHVQYSVGIHHTARASRDSLLPIRNFSEPSRRNSQLGRAVRPSTPSGKPVNSMSAMITDKTRVVSPEPLPHLLRRPSMQLANTAPADIPRRSSTDDEEFKPQDDASTVGEMPRLQRRRSILKRTASLGGDPKTVSWVPGDEIAGQVDQYIKAAGELQRSGTEYDEMRSAYLEHISGLDDLHRNVSESLDRLRKETLNLEKLQQDIASQREKLKVTCDALETKHAHLQTKVQAALDVTKRTIATSQLTREHIDETSEV